MKTKIFITLFTACSMLAFSQTTEVNGKQKNSNDEIKTIFGKNVSHGAYGAFTMNYSAIEGKDALVLGGRGGWIINHSLTIGLAGYGFANDIYFDDVINNKGFNLAGGYGGLLFEPIIYPKFPVHVAFPVLFGVGGISYTTWSSDGDNGWDYYMDDSDAFLVIEPGVEVDLNVLKFMRIAFGAYYRYAYDIHLVNTDSDILNGLSGGITLKFGKF